MSNSSLELHSADFRIFGDFADSSLVSTPKILKNYESQTENPSVVVALPRIYESKRESIIFRHCEANRRFAEAIPKNKCALAPQISPDSWCKKSDSSEQKCERRFFARIGKSEALPLKAKSDSFWRVGGAGRGVQPFCEKKQAILKNKVAIILPQKSNKKLTKSTFKA